MVRMFGIGWVGGEGGPWCPASGPGIPRSLRSRPFRRGRKGQRRLASVGYGCVGGRRAVVPRVRPGHPPLVSLRCTRAPLRWSEGGVRVWRRWVTAAWGEVLAWCAARPPRASPARFAALHSPPPYAGAKGAGTPPASALLDSCLRRNDGVGAGMTGVGGRKGQRRRRYRAFGLVGGDF